MAASNRNPDNTVFVGNIPYGVTEEMLTEIFSEVGPVKFFRLVTDRETGRQKGFGFCEYYDMETAQSAIRNLGGHEVNGRHLRVDSTDSSTKANEARQGGDKGPGNPGQVISQAEATQAAQGMAAAVGSANMGPGQDQITDALAKMPRAALFDIMAQMRGLIQQNQQQARQILVTNPSLTRALFQAQILLGMLKNPLATGTVPPQQQPTQAPLQPGPAQQQQQQQQQQQYPQPHIAQQAPQQALQQQAMPMQAPMQAVRPQQAQHAPANGQYPPQEHMQPQPVSQIPGGPGRGAPRPGPAPQAQPAMQYGASMQQGPPAPGAQPRAQPMPQAHIMPAQPQAQGQGQGQVRPQDPRMRGGIDPRQQAQPQPQPAPAPAQPQQNAAANLPVEQQKVLLQQIMQLTPAQIEGLPPEQKAQVLALQQQMRSQPSMLQ